MSQPVKNALCEHQVVSEKSHEFLFHDDGREAVQAWAKHIEQLQLAQSWYNKGHINLLMDAREAVNLPIRYLFEILSDYNRHYPSLDAPRVKMAYLRSPETVVLDVYSMMAELFEPPLTVQFFTDENKARTWLQS
ncbi:MAG: hypothetical protein Q9P01_10965 [Anaerolineae bacterium]|nr:hypothetical protein [Anaerolineae bacterium]MDQ7035325.1 hypothetical protein [Anaerolineae bacterium]